MPADKQYQEAVDHVLDLTADKIVLEQLRAVRQNQHRHEEAWYKARNAIKDKYTKKRELNSVLLNVSGKRSAEDDNLEAEETAELAKYDQKLRFAMQAMHVGQQKELQSLGVPTVASPEDMRRLYAIIDELLQA